MLSTLLALVTSQPAAMSCGDGVEVCGVLTVMTGLGAGVQNVSGGAVYGHPTAIVHGLWPQVPPYGKSRCVAPSWRANATYVFPCYICARGDDNCSSTPGHSPLQFEAHEWSKHGVCAGVQDSTDYFSQVCGLALRPVELVGTMRAAGERNLTAFATRLEAADPAYEVHFADESTMELQLSACREESSGEWRLAPVHRFAEECGGRRIRVW